MQSSKNKRHVDAQAIAQWVNQGDRVLDLGCGRGVLLEHLKQKDKVYGIGVDIDLDKIISCLKRGVSAFQGDIKSFLNQFEDNAFDRVILSRTVDQLEDPDWIINKSLKVGKSVTVGFVNHGYWVNRANAFFHGSKTQNEVYPNPWYQSLPSNPFSINEFESFCKKRNIKIQDRICYSGDWKKKQNFLCNLLAGYAIYDLSINDN
tara:strand:- start:2581 stop:3195 length:615 start_codon:yes stop_codon:yes gene_type:complete